MIIFFTFKGFNLQKSWFLFKNISYIFKYNQLDIYWHCICKKSCFGL